jgi:hypothetical protein
MLQLKAYVSSRSIVMSHSVEALKASVSSRSIVISHSVEALKASVSSRSIVNYEPREDRSL